MSVVNTPEWGVFLWLVLSLGLGDLVVTFYRTGISGCTPFLCPYVILVFTLKTTAYDINK